MSAFTSSVGKNAKTEKQSKWPMKLLALLNAIFQDVSKIPQCRQALTTLVGIVLGKTPELRNVIGPK